VHPVSDVAVPVKNARWELLYIDKNNTPDNVYGIVVMIKSL